MPRRRVPLTRVARIYQEALQQGLPPTKTVAEVLELPYSTATKKIADARKMNLLQAVDVQTGHYSTSAVIHRGTGRERHFEVCGACLHLWPCEEASRGD